MVVLHSLRSNWSLNGWQEHLAEMCGEQNQNRKPLETLARVMEMSSGMARGLRNNEAKVLSSFAPRALAWALGLCTQLGINLEEAVWDSYPGVCTHCRKAEKCVCDIAGTRGPRIRDQTEIEQLQSKYPMPDTVVEWQAMFKRIYFAVNNQVGALKSLSQKHVDCR